MGGTDNPPSSCLIKLLSLTLRVYSVLLRRHFPCICTHALFPDLHPKVTECWGQNVCGVPSLVLHSADSKSETELLSRSEVPSLFRQTVRGVYDSAFSPFVYLKPHPLLGVCTLGPPISRLATPPQVSSLALPCDPALGFGWYPWALS